VSEVGLTDESAGRAFSGFGVILASLQNTSPNSQPAFGFPFIGKIAVITVRVAANRQQLRNGCQLAPFSRMPHFPANPI
jgi:hypothetical protein